MDEIAKHFPFQIFDPFHRFTDSFCSSARQLDVPTTTAAVGGVALAFTALLLEFIVNNSLRLPVSCFINFLILLKTKEILH